MFYLHYKTVNFCLSIILYVCEFFILFFFFISVYSFLFLIFFFIITIMILIFFMRSHSNLFLSFVVQWIKQRTFKP